MKNLKISVVALALFAFIGCKNENKTNMDDMDDMDDGTNVEMQDDTEMDDMADDMAKVVTVNMESKSGSTAKGTITFSEENGNVKMEANLSGLKPGTHAIHIHESSDCSAADGKSAGGHWNPTHVQHGKWGDAKGYHKGDIGNFEADSDGNGTVSLTTDEWCVGCGDANKDIIGKSVIVHEGTDDFVSQPSGDAGSRISCGGIIMNQ